MDVVLANQTARANGFVSLAPRRSVWFSTPPQDAGRLSGEWYQLLAVHEMRHVVQFDRMRRGLVRLGWLLGGELGQAAASFLLVPPWFWEGDAVGIETALSETGRGRMPRFGLHIRALLLSGRRYSYYKAHHRSYRDWYPDHYQLGYYLTTYVRRHHGAEAWDKVLGSTTRWGLFLPVTLPWSFSFALRQHTGASAARTYERTMDELTALWQAQQEDLPTTPLRVLAGQDESGVWTNYRFPQPLTDGSVLAGKSGLADPPTLVRLHPDGREERVRFYQSLGGLRAAGGIAAWNRPTPDRRWGFRDWSDVMVMDIDSGRIRQLTHKGKLFAPAPSPDGARIAAVEFGPDRRCHLVLLETASGAEVARFPAPDGVFWRTPAWSEDGRHIAVLRQDEGGQHARAHRPGERPRRDRVAPHSRRCRLAGVLGSLPVVRFTPWGHRQHPRRPPAERRPIPGDLAASGGDPRGGGRRLAPLPGVHRRRLPHRRHAPGPGVLDADRAGRGPPGELLRTIDPAGAGRTRAGGDPAAGLSGERIPAAGQPAQRPQLGLQSRAAGLRAQSHLQRSARPQQHERGGRIQQQRGRLQRPRRVQPGGVVPGAQPRRALGRAGRGLRDQDAGSERRQPEGQGEGGDGQVEREEPERRRRDSL